MSVAHSGVTATGRSSALRVFRRSRMLSAAPLLATALVLPAGSAPAAAAPAEDGAVKQSLDLTQYVDPHIGTAISSTSGFAGNVSPGAKVPFGMVTFGPDMPRTDYNGSGGYLLPADEDSGEANFFSLTHINGPGCPGQGVVGMMPRTDATPVTDDEGTPQNPETFQTANESSAPGAYSVTLDSGVDVELGATTRTGAATFTYPDADEAYFSLDTRLNANSNSSADAGKIKPESVSLEVSNDGTVLSGKTVAPAFCTPWGTPYNSNVYFYAEFDRTLEVDQDDDSDVNDVINESAVLQYDVPEDDPTLDMRVGISPVSVENAQENLEAESEDATLEEVRNAADELWNERLNTVQIDRAADPESLSEEQREELVKFYTFLYRALGSPTVYSDVNGDFRSMEADEILSGEPDRKGSVEERETVNVADYDYTKPNGEEGSYNTHYSTLSFWDTYRSQAQLLALLAPDVASDVAQSAIVDGQQCGALPHWVDASDDSTPMTGDNALPVIAGTYAFGARDFDVTTAARLFKQSSFDEESACNGNASFSGMSDYLDYGYYTNDDHTSSNIERYNSDYAAAEFLSDVQDTVQDHVSITDDQIDELYDRAGWWTSILDEDSGTLRSRVTPEESGTPGDFADESSFHESTEPNYFWTFAHAWDGLIDGIGGDDEAIERLNTLFSMDDELTNEPTLEQLNGGEDADTFYMGNQPSYHAPWAYNWAGKPSGTQHVVSQLRSTAFGIDRDGMPGNDDLGAQSSWFVFASLGLFPVIPSEEGLAISSPMFPAATVWLDGEPVRITTEGDPADSAFIESMAVDGEEYGRSWMKGETLTNASEISFVLSSTPTSWAEDVHPSAAAETTTDLDLSPTSQEAGDDVTAQVEVTSADQTRPEGTVEVRMDDSTVAEEEKGDSAGTVDIAFTVPEDSPAETVDVAASFSPADPSFLEASESDVVELEITSSDEEPSPDPTDPGTDESGTDESGTDETGGSDADGAAENPDGSGDSAESNDTGQLPKTGTTVTGIILAALLLVAGGLVLRRRKTV